MPPNEAGARKMWSVARPPSNTREYKVAMSDELAPMLEALTTLGLYGKTPSEVLRRMAEERIHQLVMVEGTLTKAGYDMPSLLKIKKATSRNKKSSLK